MQRAEKMRELRNRGLTYQQIGKLWNVSRQYVHQLLSGYSNCLKARGEYRWYGTMRRIVLERDNHKCVKCDDTNNLITHHIDGNDNHNREDNLITLCRSCHAITHQK